MNENEIYLSKFSGEEIDAKLEMISNFIQKVNGITADAAGSLVMIDSNGNLIPANIPLAEDQLF